MDTLIFIDTNIWLDFYRFPRDAGLGFLKHIDASHDRIITGSQVEMEYKKNRQRVILESYKQLQIPNWGGLKTPAFLAQSKPTRAIDRHTKAIAARVMTLKGRMEKVLRDPSRHDPVYKTAQRLFRNRSELNLSRGKDVRLEIRDLAEKRFRLGYPPRKPTDTSFGDAVNWEWIIHCAIDSAKNVVIVSRDSDYGHSFDGRPMVNDWLLQEFRERVTRKRRLTLTDRLAEAFKAASVKVTKREEDEEAALVSEGRDRGSAVESAYVESQIPCACGSLLLVHWEARLGIIVGEHSVACPSCGRRYRIPAPALRLYRREGGTWNPVPVRSGEGPAVGFDALHPSPPEPGG
jgi:PIN domain